MRCFSPHLFLFCLPPSRELPSNGHFFFFLCLHSVLFFLVSSLSFLLCPTIAVLLFAYTNINLCPRPSFC
jgi:hypothetical protein